MHTHHHGEHHHEHSHPSSSVRSRMLVTLLLTGLVMLAELFGGWWSGSLSLLADAGHMLTDFLALVVAFAAMSLSQKPADYRRTYGYRRLEILAALANGVALVILSVSIVHEAIQRFARPQPVDSRVMAIVAAAGLAANLVGLWLLRSGRGNLNVRGAFLHILGDTLSSVGVIVAALLMAVTGWTRLDAIVSLLIATVIIVTSVSLLRDVVEVLLESAPKHINTEDVYHSIVSVGGVAEVHDLHVWSIASGLPALSAHIVVADPIHDCHSMRAAIAKLLQSKYEIDHATLQMERKTDGGCGACPRRRKST